MSIVTASGYAGRFGGESGMKRQGVGAEIALVLAPIDHPGRIDGDAVDSTDGGLGRIPAPGAALDVG